MLRLAAISHVTAHYSLMQPPLLSEEVGVRRQLMELRSVQNDRQQLAANSQGTYYSERAERRETLDRREEERGSESSAG